MNLNSNLFWCIVGIVGGAILSFIISLIFYFISTKRKRLSYSIKTFCLVSDKVNQINNLEIKYNCNEIENLYSSTLIIKNVGNSIIEKQDFALLYPPLLYTNGEFLIDKSNTFLYGSVDNFGITYNTDSNNKITKIIFEFDYIPIKGSISCSFFHTDNISFECKLKDGKIVQIQEESKFDVINNYILDVYSRILDIIILGITAIHFYNKNIGTAIFLLLSFLYINGNELIMYIKNRKKN